MLPIGEMRQPCSLRCQASFLDSNPTQWLPRPTQLISTKHNIILKTVLAAIMPQPHPDQLDTMPPALFFLLNKKLDKKHILFMVRFMI